MAHGRNLRNFAQFERVTGERFIDAYRRDCAAQAPTMLEAWAEARAHGVAAVKAGIRERRERARGRHQPTGRGRAKKAKKNLKRG